MLLYNRINCINHNQVTYRSKKMNATVAANYPSLCIPRVFANISENRIRQVFNELALGQILRIDMIERRSDNGDVYKRVFIHFDKWSDNVDAVATRQRLISGKDIKIVYDNPWFWKVSANRSAEIKDNKTITSQINELPRAPCLNERKTDILPRAPCLDRRQTDDIRRPDDRRQMTASVPKLVLKVKVPVPMEDVVIPRSPSSSPPRQRPKTNNVPEKVEEEPDSDIPTFDDMYSDLL